MTATDGNFYVADVIQAAFRRSGVEGLGQTMSGDDTLDAQLELSNMLAQWNTKTWLVWDKIDVSVIATGQATPYTIGPATVNGVATGAQIVLTERPDRVEQAYIRILGGSGGGGFGAGGQPVDQPLNMIPAAESYADIALKQLVAFSKAWYYQPETPVGNLYFYPWPQGGGIYEMHAIIKNAFPLIVPLKLNLDTFAPVVRAAMIYCLAQRLRMAYGKGPNPVLDGLAKDALTTMRMSQVAAPQLTMPPMLNRPNHYNIFGDITY